MPEIHAFYLRKLYEDSRLKKVKEEFSPKTKKIKEEKLKKHKMNRITSMDNFMKFSWPWTL
tara:strand:+ start:246 stop:428 length:183 start_codon:yes stop_codon:yes gene_type:complete